MNLKFKENQKEDILKEIEEIIRKHYPPEEKQEQKTPDLCAQSEARKGQKRGFGTVL